VLNEVAGQDLSGSSTRCIADRDVFDYGIETFRSERNTGRGFFGDAPGPAFAGVGGA
jgi:hypothetical protein